MIKLNGITKKYIEENGDETVALDNVDLKFESTGLVIINGTSGCGKTTLMNMLAGLDVPTFGEIFFDDINITHKSEQWWDNFRCQNIGFIYQDFNLIENQSVWNNIELPLKLKELNAQARKDKVINILEQFDIGDFAEHKVGKLSGGQKQRVAIARALIGNPKVVLADEPTGNLDEKNSEKVFEILKKISNNHLVIVVTHDVSIAEKYADRIIQIHYGKIKNDIVKNNIKLEDGSIENVSIREEKYQLSVKDCLLFAKDAMRQRKCRAAVSVFMFAITMLIIMLSCTLVFRNDTTALIEYIEKKDFKVIGIYKNIPEEYQSIVGDDEVTYGKKFYDYIDEMIDSSRIVKYEEMPEVCTPNDDFIMSVAMYVNDDNKKYFSYEGKYPEEADELAVSKSVIAYYDDMNIIGNKILFFGKEYKITAVIEEICGMDVDDVYIDDGCDGNFSENIIFIPDKVIDACNNSSIYTSVFSGVKQNNLQYQASVFSDVCSVENCELISGRFPKNDNEILVSDTLFADGLYKEQDIVDNKFKIYDFLEKKYDCTFWEHIHLQDYIGDEIVVVGIASGDAEYYVTQKLYDEMNEDYNKYFRYNCFLLYDKDNIYHDVNKLANENFKFNISKLGRVYDLIANIDALKKGIIIVVLIVIILVMLQMISLYSYSISDNKRIIAVLRTLGVEKKDTQKIFAIECLLITILAVIVGFVCNILFIYIINNYIDMNVVEINEYRFLRIRAIVILCSIMLSIIMSLISVFIPIHKYSKKKIVELLK